MIIDLPGILLTTSRNVKKKESNESNMLSLIFTQMNEDISYKVENSILLLKETDVKI